MLSMAGLAAHSEILRLTTSFTDSVNTSSASSTGPNRSQQQQPPDYPIHRFSAGPNGSVSDVKALEHPTLKVPYEILNKKFRSAQKNVDREVSHVQATVNDLEKAVIGQGSGPATVGAISELLNGVIEKLTVLKRKAEESVSEELDAANVCKKRLDHLKEYCSKSSSEGTAVTQWKKKRLDRMLVEHFLRCGYYDTAIKLAVHSEIEDLTNIELFLVSRQVEESLARNETTKCLNWCYDNKSKLRKIHSCLEFNLRQQEFVELIRQERRFDAIKHARKYFSVLESCQKQQLELQHVMGLLAFKADTQVDPYKSLFDESRWVSLIEQFRRENFKLFQLSSTSVFTVTLQSGLSALKTPQCYKKDGERNPDCPVCSPLMNQLAGSLPCAHCSQSRLVCFISGQPLNEHNHPLVLPNGYVYGENSLKLMAAENNGKITCPRTKEVYDLKEAEKVFVM